MDLQFEEIDAYSTLRIVYQCKTVSAIAQTAFASSPMELFKTEAR